MSQLSQNTPKPQATQLYRAVIRDSGGVGDKKGITILGLGLVIRRQKEGATSFPKLFFLFQGDKLNPQTQNVFLMLFLNIFFSHLFNVTGTNGSPSTTNVYTRPYDDVVLIFVLKNKILLIANNRDTIILV